MKLFKFPYLVQQEILHNFEYKNLLLLSFVSKNMNKLIKSSQIARFKSVNFIEYGSGRSDEPLVYIPHKNTRYTILKLTGPFENPARHENDYFTLNISGKIVDVRVCIFHGLVVFSRSWEPVIKSIHNYLLNLFGSSVEYRWTTSTRTDLFEVFIPRLKNLSVLNTSCGENDMKTVDTYLLSSPVIKRIDFFIFCSLDRGFFSRCGYMPTEEPFPPESKLYQAQSIGVTQRELATPAVLRHYQGRQAFIKCERCENQDLIEFINRWKSGEAFRNLEYLEIEILISEVPQNRIFYATGTKYIDVTKRSPTHTLPKIFIDNGDDEPNTDPITSHAYVVRESDGHVASVQIQRDTFSFGVWDKTEEEFLRMVE
ncbi:Protein CBG22207 [Caenorhabditis briggsae]|uniref:Protein CBG22207 n=1 Tax=Caenorhabditis briggsae TaxID=6238 RepID=A8Y1S7_CAEBR|nr:Protein CBG22207 [Caenorhabditis briggsae]CAP38847.2 Protein CBG22207 [Caenorhabditis briggsae]